MNYFDNQIFISGGVNKENEVPIQYFEAYDTVSNKIKLLPPNLYARHSHSSCVTLVGGKHYLYLIGGIGPEKTYQRRVERYCLEKSAWQEVVLMNQCFELINPFSI